MFRSPREQASRCTYRIEDRSEMTSNFGVPSRDVRPALRAEMDGRTIGVDNACGHCRIHPTDGIDGL